MIAIYGKVSTTDERLCVDDVVTDVVVRGNICHAMAYDREAECTFIYGCIVDGRVSLFEKMEWDCDIVTILPVLEGQSLYAEGSATIETIGQSGENRVLMVVPIQARCIGVGNDEDLTIYDLRTCISNRQRAFACEMQELVV